MISYARRLGLFSATMAVIGGIIGSGIFATPNVVAQRVGTTGLALGTWVLGGIVALIGAYCYAELGERMPKAGGQYVYLRDAIGPLPAFLYGWALLLVMATGAAAFVAVTFANYAVSLFGMPATATVPVAVAAIVVVCGINYVGVTPGAITQNIFTVLKLGALGVLIACGLFLARHAVPAVDASAAVAVPRPAGAWGAFVAVGAALVPVLFTYGGWQQTNFIAEEIVDAERNLPRALVGGVLVVVAVYLLANIVYLRVLGAAGLAATPAPAAEVMQRLLGPGGKAVISAGIAVSSFGFLDLVILVTPRVFQAMAADGVFFHRLARLHPTYRTPDAAILLMGAWAIALTLTKTYGPLADYVVFGDWIFFGASVATLFVYRARERAGAPAALRFRTPGYPWMPALFVLAAVYVVISSVGSNPRNAAVGAGLILLGVPAFLYWARRRRA
jgi:APA family basic amino acid/polyamine antiporter